MSGLRQQVLSGVAWQSAAAAAGQGLSLLVGIALARLLSPVEFGLVAMVMVVTGFLRLGVRLGVGAAVVGGSGVEDQDLPSLFWANVAAGLTAAALVVAGAPLIARFYGEAALLALSIALASELVFEGFTVVPRALLERRLDFRTISRFELATTVVSSLAALALAAAGAGVWALAARPPLAAALRAGASWRASGFRPRLELRRASLARLGAFGRNVTANQSLHYWTRNLDSLLVGRVLGVDALGFYDRAYRLLMIPLAQASRVVSGVLLPSLSRIRGEPERMRSLFVRALSSVALLSFPLNLGLIACMDALVAALLGPQWLQMVAPARWLCAAGLVQALANLNRTLYLSQGRPDLQLRYGLLFRGFALLGIVAGLPWGIAGVAAGYAIATAAVWLPNTAIAGGLVGLHLGTVTRALRGVLACALAMAGLVWATGSALADRPDALRLAAQLASGIVSYPVLLALFRVPAFADLITTLHAHWSQTTDDAGTARAR